MMRKLQSLGVVSYTAIHNEHTHTILPCISLLCFPAALSPCFFQLNGSACEAIWNHGGKAILFIWYLPKG